MLLWETDVTSVLLSRDWMRRLLAEPNFGKNQPLSEKAPRAQSAAQKNAFFQCSG